MVDRKRMHPLNTLHAQMLNVTSDDVSSDNVCSGNLSLGYACLVSRLL
jgi:hypothetical protein